MPEGECQTIVTAMAPVAHAIAPVASQPRMRHRQGRTRSLMIFVGRDTATMTATMIGTEMTALTTADQ